MIDLACPVPDWLIVWEERYQIVYVSVVTDLVSTFKRRVQTDYINFLGGYK